MNRIEMGRFARNSCLLLFVVVMISLVERPASAAQSTITEAESYACMGYDKSKKQTEEEALANAQRKAMESVSTYIKSETRVKDFQLEKDLIEAYAKATVKVIEELERSWYRDASSGDCFKVKIRAEVLPDEKAMVKLAKGVADDPAGPLHIQVWTNKKEYVQGERVKIYIKANKPFYARLSHQEARGKILQLLPNPYRKDNYFQGGVVYEFPSGDDRFELEVTPPFGEEEIMVYAGTQPLGDIDLEALGSVYAVRTKPKDIGIKTRAVKIKPKEAGSEVGASEFFEGSVKIMTK